MADYAISNVPRRVVYANSGVGPYAFTFEILSQTDSAVYRDWETHRKSTRLNSSH